MSYRVSRKKNPKNLNKGKSMRSIVTVNGKTTVVDHGAKNATIKPGTEKGNSYCARSKAIGNTPANLASRAAWNCDGAVSKKSRPKFYSTGPKHDMEAVKTEATHLNKTKHQTQESQQAKHTNHHQARKICTEKTHTYK